MIATWALAWPGAGCSAIKHTDSRDTYGNVLYSTVLSSTLQYSKEQYSTALYITLQCCTVHYSTVQCCTVVVVETPTADVPQTRYCSYPLKHTNTPEYQYTIYTNTPEYQYTIYTNTPEYQYTIYANTLTPRVDKKNPYCEYY